MLVENEEYNQFNSMEVRNYPKTPISANKEESPYEGQSIRSILCQILSLIYFLFCRWKIEIKDKKEKPPQKLSRNLITDPEHIDKII